MTLELLKAGLALIGGLIGAYVGARLALTRFKRERAYDKRLEWHLAALAKVHDLEEETSRWNPSEGTERTAAYHKAAAGFRRVMVESRAFMNPSAAALVEAAHTKHYFAGMETWAALAENQTAEALRSIATKEMECIRKAEVAIIAELKRLVPDDTRSVRLRMLDKVQRVIGRPKSSGSISGS